jgi:hypothetical protein
MSLFKGLRAQRLLALFGVSVVLLSYPVLSLASEGLWALPMAVFGVWLLVILAIALLAERAGRKPPDHEPQGPVP